MRKDNVNARRKKLRERDLTAGQKEALRRSGLRLKDLPTEREMEEMEACSRRIDEGTETLYYLKFSK